MTITDTADTIPRTECTEQKHNRLTQRSQRLKATPMRMSRSL